MFVDKHKIFMRSEQALVKKRNFDFVSIEIFFSLGKIINANLHA
jgi:hypothetical protein